MIKREPDFQRRGGILGVVLGLLAVLVLLGLFFGWFDFGVSSQNADGEDGDRVQLEFGINKDEIAEDTNALVAKVREWSEGDDAEQVDGTVVGVDSVAKVMSVRTESDEELTFGLADSTRIESEDTLVPISNLANGQHVEITYLEDDDTDQKVAVKVKIEKRS
ncbi:MAG: hypothetical protein RL885_32100 [Planctomycetota bacterium]